MTISIRSLEDSDLERADTILKLAFQGSLSRLRELQLYRQIQPDGWFVACQEGLVVGMVGSTNYGAVAHVGFMAVHPQAQRQGVGLALMQYLLEKLEHQVRLVTLDASTAGRPLYDKLGFAAYDETLVFQRQGSTEVRDRPAPISAFSRGEMDELVERDSEVFGANRQKVLQALLDSFPGRAFMQRDENGKIMGFLFAQNNRIGPWVMFHSHPAEALLLAALSLPFDGAVSINVPSGNQEAIVLLQRHGFEHVRSNRHMGRGVGGPPGDREKVYAQTSLALG